MKSLSLLIFACLFVFLFSLAAVCRGGTYNGGDGSAGTPYQISSPANWQELMATSADWQNKHFLLTADVNLVGITVTPVGNDSSRFTGVFDGNGHVVRNAVINLPGSLAIGLFGYIGSTGEIRNLGAEGANVTGGNFTGGLVGLNDGTITNCHSISAVSGIDNEGGGTNNIGGLAGINHGTITNCYSSGTVGGAGYVGGLTGYNNTLATVANCYSSSTVSGLGYFVGGLAGYNAGNAANCYSSGVVTGGGVTGGLVGYATSTGTITNCYSSGHINCSYLVGGMVGLADSGTHATASFWDINTSGKPISYQGTGKTTADMKKLSTFTDAGWDFVNDWGIGDGQTYPYLKQFNKVNPADMNYSGTVDFQDFAVFAQHWLDGVMP